MDGKIIQEPVEIIKDSDDGVKILYYSDNYSSNTKITLKKFPAVVVGSYYNSQKSGESFCFALPNLPINQYYTYSVKYSPDNSVSFYWYHTLSGIYELTFNDFIGQIMILG